jgi:transposase-like protein
MAAGISTYSYHPRADQNLSNTASVWGIQVGYDTLTLVVKEFWPDIRHKFRKNKQQP